jgi:putative transposase
MDQERNTELALVAFTKEERQEAMMRFAGLRPHLNEDIPLSEAARNAGIPLRSVQRWLTRYRAAGSVGLVRAKRADTGNRNLPAKLVELIEGMALRKPRPSVAASLSVLGRGVGRYNVPRRENDHDHIRQYCGI